MLISELNNETVRAWEVINRSADYRCPECKQSVILKKGEYKVPHFAHKISDGCTYGEGMTEAHLTAQKEIFTILRGAGYKCEVEYKFKGRRADVYAEVNEKKIVFEIQHSNISPEEILARNQFYSKEGCSVIWVLTDDFYGRLKALVNPDKGIRLSQWQIRLNDMYGTIYVWRDSNLVAYQFENAIRNEEFNPVTREYEYTGEYQLKKTFDKIGYAKIDLLWGIKNGILTSFTEDLYATSCFGLSPENDYAADWKNPDKNYSFSDPMSVAS